MSVDQVAKEAASMSASSPSVDKLAALVDRDHKLVDTLTCKALDEGTEALEIMDDGLIAAMRIVGIKFPAKSFLVIFLIFFL